MPNALCKSQIPQYRSLFPDWTGPRPLRYFLIENLLESRKQSEFPTNILGPDEDVNIYLAALLTDFLGGKHPSDVLWGADPLLFPPAKHLNRRARADFYRHNAEHRLIMLGLFDRGDHLRRWGTFFQATREETRDRDLSVGQNCFNLAADILENRKMGCSGLTTVWRKLAENFDLYVQVLSTMAVEKLGLGASLSQTDMQLLITAPSPEATAPKYQMDHLLDLLLEMRQPGGQEKRAEVIDLALKLNLNPAELLRQAG